MRFHAVIEIPAGSRNKYEIDHESGEIWLDRHLFVAMTYPLDYGFIPETLAEDGDPVDVISPQEWLGAICCGVALRYKDTAASLQTVQMHLKTDFPEHRMALLSLSNMHNAV